MRCSHKTWIVTKLVTNWSLGIVALNGRSDQSNEIILEMEVSLNVSIKITLRRIQMYIDFFFKPQLIVRRIQK